MKIPSIQLVPYNQYNAVVETIVRQLLIINFWVAFIGWWKIWQWIKPLLEKL